MKILKSGMILNLQRLTVDNQCESLHKGINGNKEIKMFIPKSRVLETLQKIGYDNTFHVTFQKTDGTERKMTCTMPTPDKPQFELKDNMPVVDLDKGAWRSFNLSRVTEITL
jgi:hypothetical protein